MKTYHQTPRSIACLARARRGATAVELAITLMVFVILVIGVMELSMLVFQNHVINHAARQAVRKVIVHGELAPDDFAGGPWGPATYGPKTLGGASGSDPVADVLRDEILILDPDRTTVTIEWLDGNNKVDSRVRVQLETEVDSLAGFFFGDATLTGQSEMRIAH